MSQIVAQDDFHLLVAIDRGIIPRLYTKICFLGGGLYTFYAAGTMHGVQIKRDVLISGSVLREGFHCRSYLLYI